MADSTPPVLREYHVLLMAATDVVVLAENPTMAALVAVQQAPGTVDPQQVQWVARNVSDRPFEIAGPDETEESRLAEEAEANRQRVETPRIQLLS